MYLKYTVQSGTDVQVQNEIGDLLMGDITDVSTCVYGSATLAGTGPTAGTYTRTTDATTTHLKLIKKHAQWNAVTMPATMELRVGNNGGYAVLQVSDQTGGNSGYTTYPGGSSLMAFTANMDTVGTTFHFIINDTTFAMNVTEVESGNPYDDAQGGTMWSDFEVTSYDEYAIGVNPLYYPGGAVGHVCNYPLSAYISSASTFNMISAYRFQFQAADDGSFKNATLPTTYNQASGYFGHMRTKNTLAYFSTEPTPNKRLFKTWSSLGQSIVMQPLLIAPDHGNFNTTHGPNSNLAIDARMHNVMLNIYRITDMTGVTGDYLDTADNTRYYIFGGHRSGNVPNSASSGDETNAGTHYMTNYAMPVNNVTMP